MLEEADIKKNSKLDFQMPFTIIKENDIRKRIKNYILNFLIHETK